METMMQRGLLETPLKKLKGARLPFPSGPMVEMKAMGLGTTEPMRSL
jgi:hypothetical protein